MVVPLPLPAAIKSARTCWIFKSLSIRRRRNIRSAFKLFNTVFSSALSPELTTYFCISIVMTSTSSTGKELRLFRWERA